MSGVTLGLYTDASVEIGGVARAAESARFSTLWVYDSPAVFSDTSIACLLALQSTDSIVVGPGVASPVQRPPVYTAQFLTTMLLLAPGRVTFGIGTGNSSAHSVGLRPATMGRVIDHVADVRELVAGNEAARDGTTTRLLHQQPPWVRTGSPIECWVSAFGARGQRRAASVADGILVRWEGRSALRRARAEIAEGARAVGKNPQAIKVGVVTMLYPYLDDHDLASPEARAALGPLLISRIRYLAANPPEKGTIPPGLEAAVREYVDLMSARPESHRHLDNYLGYLVFVPPSLEFLVTAERIEELGSVGSPDFVASELVEMQEAGVDHVSLQMAGDQTAYCNRFANQIEPLCPWMFAQQRG